MDNFVLRVVPELSSIPAAVCLQHRDQWVLEVTSMDARNRCWQILTSRPPSMRFFSDEMYKEDPTQAFLIGHSPSQLISRKLEMYVLAHSSEREISDSESDASKLWIQKWKHSIHTNFRKYRKRSIPWTEEIGDLKTVERKSDSRNDHQFAPVVQTPFSGCYPRETKTSQGTEKSLRKFLEPSQKPKDIYTDNSLEFGKSCEELSWIIEHPLLFYQKTNGIAERATRQVKEGTSAVLLQSGLDEKWWSDSMKCYYYLQNVQNLLTDGKSQYERRSGESFKGPIKLLDALVGYLRKLRERQSTNSTIWIEIITRNFIGYGFIRGWKIWEEDILITDVEELKNLASSHIYF